MKILKGLGIIGCSILVIVKWCMIIPAWMFTGFLLTGRFFNEFDFACLPEEWFYDLIHEKEITKNNLI
jgi:hypothetical protein